VSGQLHDPAALPMVHIRKVAGWASPRGGLDALTKRKFLGPAENQASVVQLIVSHFTDCILNSVNLYFVISVL
jgi:hypothetical protein